jgi:hypothetical protein
MGIIGGGAAIVWASSSHMGTDARAVEDESTMTNESASAAQRAVP